MESVVPDQIELLDLRGVGNLREISRGPVRLGGWCATDCPGCSGDGQAHRDDTLRVHLTNCQEVVAEAPGRFTTQNTTGDAALTRTARGPALTKYDPALRSRPL